MFFITFDNTGDIQYPVTFLKFGLRFFVQLTRYN